MIFVTLVKFRKKITKQDAAGFDRRLAQAEKEGVKLLSDYYTFGRYDSVMVFETPSEKPLMKFLLSLADVVGTETLQAVPKAEARELL